MTPQHAELDRQYWRSNVRIIAGLMAIWALFSLVFSVLLIEPLNQFTIGKVPLGFWIAHQGTMYVFLGLIGAYIILMNRLDRWHEKAVEELEATS